MPVTTARVRELTKRSLYEMLDTSQDLAHLSRTFGPPGNTTAVSGSGYRGYNVKIMCMPPENLGEPRQMDLSVRADDPQQAKAAALDVAAKMNFVRTNVIDIVEVPQPAHNLGAGSSINASPVGDVVTPNNINPGLPDPQIPSIVTQDFDDLQGDVLDTEPSTPGPRPSPRYAPALAP